MVRASSEENSERARQNIQAGLDDLGLPGVAFEFNYTKKVMPAVMNDPELVHGALDTIRSLLGEDGLVMVESVPPFFGEDFSCYLQKIPGVIYWLGVSNEEKGIVGMPHNPQFAVDEEAIFVGTRTMAALLLHYLETFK